MGIAQFFFLYIKKKKGVPYKDAREILIYMCEKIVTFFHRLRYHFIRYKIRMRIK